LNLDEHGAAHLPGAAAPFLDGLECVIAGVPQDRAGVRLYGIGGLADLLAPDALGALAPGRMPVRALLFDKSDATNWALGWHQDRTIAVRERAEVAGFGPWSVKAGMAHVEPPFSIIERMLTLRVHFDAVDAENAPLLIAPGSHRLGRIPEPEIEGIVARSGVRECLAGRGDAWLYATPILHASAAAAAPRRRRVLQVDFFAGGLPGPLAWLGV